MWKHHQIWWWSIKRIGITPAETRSCGEKFGKKVSVHWTVIKLNKPLPKNTATTNKSPQQIFKRGYWKNSYHKLKKLIKEDLVPDQTFLQRNSENDNTVEAMKKVAEVSCPGRWKVLRSFLWLELSDCQHWPWSDTGCIKFAEDLKLGETVQYVGGSMLVNRLRIQNDLNLFLSTCAIIF